MWLSASSLLTRIFGAGRLLILAAILPQTELGLFGMAVVVMLLVEQLSQTGMRQALIQREGEIQDYLSTAWLSQILRGIVLGALLFVFAEWAESFFEKAGLASLMRWLALLPIMKGCFNIGFVYLDRELQFDKVVIHRTAISFIDNILSILFVLFWPFAISLVAARLVAVGCGIFLSFVLERRRAGIGFSLARFRELYKFGFWIFASSLLSFTMVSGGDLVTGKLLPVENLAVYQVAYSLACIPLIEIVRVLSTTMYSAFSRIQDDSNRLLLAFLRVFALVCMISACSVAGFLALSSTFTDLFLRPEYTLVASLLPVLSLWGASRALGIVNSVFFQAIGRPALATTFQVVMVAMFFVFVIPLTKNMGLLGLAWGLVIAGCVSQTGRFIMMARILEVSITRLLVRVAVPMVVGTVSFLLCIATLQFLSNFEQWIRFVAGTTVFVASFVAGTLVSELIIDFGILTFLRKHVPGVDILLANLPISMLHETKQA